MVFYDLDDAGKSFIEGNEGNDWEGIVCPEDEGHQRAGRRITELMLDAISSTVVDFSWTLLSDIVITDHALQVLKSEGLTGFEVKPATVTAWPKGLDERRIPRLWEFVVTGKAGHAHPDSGIVLRSKCEACGDVTYSAFEHGIVVDETRWDGSDFFTVVEYPKHILVPERIKDVLERHRLTNVSFVESSKLQWPAGVIKP